MGIRLEKVNKNNKLRHIIILVYFVGVFKVIIR